MASESAIKDGSRAACLTPPAAGGVAVIQVVGSDACARVSRLLRSRRPLDPARMRPDELRLCRLVDGGQTIDDVLVAVRWTTSGRAVIDLCLHGGLRVVQRALLALKSAGVCIVEQAEELETLWGTASGVERELLPVIMRSRTEAVACWLMQLVEKFSIAISGIIERVESGQIMDAREGLRQLCDQVPCVRRLLAGVRVVLCGGPNVGKSTLANALARREHAIVSEVAGTTRDWIEHPGAIDGVPFSFVDTAGIRETDHPIEREAIRRARAQQRDADIILRVFDVSVKADLESYRDGMRFEGSGAREKRDQATVTVWNKWDLEHDAGQVARFERCTDAVSVSGTTELGLDRLRTSLLAAAGLVDWRARVVGPVTENQIGVCCAVLSDLGQTSMNSDLAIDRLRKLL